MAAPPFTHGGHRAHAGQQDIGPGSPGELEIPDRRRSGKEPRRSPPAARWSSSGCGNRSGDNHLRTVTGCECRRAARDCRHASERAEARSPSSCLVLRLHQDRCSHLPGHDRCRGCAESCRDGPDSAHWRDPHRNHRDRRSVRSQLAAHCCDALRARRVWCADGRRVRAVATDLSREKRHQR